MSALFGEYLHRAQGYKTAFFWEIIITVTSHKDSTNIFMLTSCTIFSYTEVILYKWYKWYVYKYTQSMHVNVRCLRDIQDRQVACYSVSCKERHNIGTGI